MSDTHVIAVIGLIGALLGALLTSIAIPILSARMSYRPRLTVRIRCSNFSLPQLVENSALQYASGAWQKITRANSEGPIFRALCQSAVMYETTIKNPGRVACKQVDLRIQSADSVFQVGKQKFFDPKKYTAVFAKNLKLGDIGPGQEIDVTIWSPYDSPLSNPVLVSAEDLQDVKYIQERLLTPQPAWSAKMVIGLIIVSAIVGFVINKVFV